MEENKEMKEKEASEAKEKKAFSSARKVVPLYFWVILVVFLAVSIYSLTQLFQPLPEVKIQDFWKENSENGTTKERVRVIQIYPADCRECTINHSLLITFIFNGINFEMEKVEADSADGNKMIHELGLKTIPVVIVDATSITEDMFIKTKSGTQPLLNVLNYYVNEYREIRKEKDIFIFPEVSLDNMPHINMFVDSNNCGTEQVQVDLFTDPYSPIYIATSGFLGKAKTVYGSRVSWNYNYLPTDSFGLFEQYGKETVEVLAKYLVCADQQGKLTEFEDKAYTIYCDLNDDNSLDENERENCSQSPRFGQPLTMQEVKAIASAIGLEKSSLNKCLYPITDTFKEMREKADEYGIYRTPTAVINCEYETHASNIANAICVANRNLPCGDQI